MTSLTSWLSADVMRALGWALIHSLWEGAIAAALAALAMAFIRRPSLRYLIGVGALALMLAAPVATFFLLLRPTAPVQALRPVTASVLPAGPAISTTYPVAAIASADRAIGAIAQAPRQFPLPDILPWLVSAWLCGVTAFSFRFAGGFLLLEHRRRTQSHSPGERVLALCQDLQRRLGLVRAIQYLECGWVEAPAVIGWLRPAVLLPVFALTGLTEEQFRAVVAHELAHVRRHDWFVNLFQILAETLLFYHPAMWWLNQRIRVERELCCDEIAVSLTGSRLEYARALAQMAEWKNVSMLAMAANRGPLSQRILRILGRKPSDASQRVAGLTGGVLFLTAALAAANLLFGIAYPVQVAHARTSIKVALSSSRAAAEQVARQVLPAAAPAAKDAASEPTAPDQRQSVEDSQAQDLAPPLPDLSRVLPSAHLATPTVTASNAAPAAALDHQPLVPIQPAKPDGSAGLAASAAGTGSGITNARPTPSVTATKPVVMPITPSGMGDPNTIVCRAPQQIAGSNQFGPEACGHNYEWQRLMMNGKDLAPDGKTLINRPTVANPKGDGDPDAVTCRTPQFVALGPLITVCRTNRFWADVIKNHQIVDARGKVVTPPPWRVPGAAYNSNPFAYSNPPNSVGSLLTGGFSQGEGPGTAPNR